MTLVGPCGPSGGTLCSLRVLAGLEICFHRFGMRQNYNDFLLPLTVQNTTKLILAALEPFGPCGELSLEPPKATQNTVSTNMHDIQDVKIFRFLLLNSPPPDNTGTNCLKQYA